MAELLERPGASQVRTMRLDGSQPVYLGTLGHVATLHYSYACPGGCDQMTANLEITARQRPTSIDPGRLVQVIRGGSVIWAGTLDEPQPSASGWQIIAHGAGGYGANFCAIYTGKWDNTTPDKAINAAITRGLPWVNPGIGNPAGMWIGQQVDSGAQQISDLLNLITTKGSLTWYIATRPSGNVLSVFPLPTKPTHLLVAASPVARTVGGALNTVWVRYQTKADSAATPATYDITNAVDQPSINKYGPLEQFADVSSAQVITNSAALAVGDNILDRYQRASYAAAFTAGPGQLLNPGGAPYDLGSGMPYAPMVCQAIMTDYAPPGEEVPGPVTFLVGEYEFDDDSQSAQVTPFQYLASDFASLLSAIVSTEPIRKGTAATQDVTHIRRG